MLFSKFLKFRIFLSQRRDDVGFLDSGVDVKIGFCRSGDGDHCQCTHINTTQVNWKKCIKLFVVVVVMSTVIQLWRWRWHNRLCLLAFHRTFFCIPGNFHAWKYWNRVNIVGLLLVYALLYPYDPRQMQHEPKTLKRSRRMERLFEDSAKTCTNTTNTTN